VLGTGASRLTLTDKYGDYKMRANSGEEYELPHCQLKWAIPAKRPQVTKEVCCNGV
jgi:hypothetical protein